MLYIMVLKIINKKKHAHTVYDKYQISSYLREP